MLEPPCVILLYRAILTLDALPDPDARWFQLESTWPTYARRYLDAYNPDEETEARFRPTPQDVTTYLGVLDLARNLSQQQRRIMQLRAHGYSLRNIAEVLRSTIGLVEHDHAEAVRIVVAAAADTPPLASGLDNSPAMGPIPRRHHRA